MTGASVSRFLLATVLCACATTPGAASAPASPYDVTFKTLDGRATTLKQFQGKVVVVHVFTTWDLPGLREVAELRRLVGEHGKDVAAVGVGLDMEGALALTSFERTLKPGYPVWLPDAAFVDGRTVFGKPVEVPRVYILARDGTIRHGFVGYVPYAELEHMVLGEMKR